jgi:hypothetical protein
VRTAQYKVVFSFSAKVSSAVLPVAVAIAFAVVAGLHSDSVAHVRSATAWYRMQELGRKEDEKRGSPHR